MSPPPTFNHQRRARVCVLKVAQVRPEPSIMLKLGDGTTIPQIGFGTFQIPDEEAEAPVLAALTTGYRHIDTAQMYNNQDAIGRAIAASGVPRGEIFITTKVSSSNTYDETVQFAAEAVAKLGEGERYRRPLHLRLLLILLSCCWLGSSRRLSSHC